MKNFWSRTVLISVLLKAARASDERQSLMSQGNRKISSYSLASSAGRSSDVSIRTSTSSSAISSSSSQPSNSAGGGGGGTREHTQVHVDSDLVKQLTDMGFKPQLSKLALVLNGYALWIITWLKSSILYPVFLNYMFLFLLLNFLMRKKSFCQTFSIVIWRQVANYIKNHISISYSRFKILSSKALLRWVQYFKCPGCHAKIIYREN